MEACVESLKRLIKLFPGTIGAKPSLWYIYIYIWRICGRSTNHLMDYTFTISNFNQLAINSKLKKSQF